MTKQLFRVSINRSLWLKRKEAALAWVHNPRKNKKPKKKSATERRQQSRKMKQAVVKGRQYHARKRARQRYHLELTFDELAELNRRVQEGDRAYCCDRLTHTATLWAIQFQSRWLVAVYKSTSGTITTFLPPERLERYWDKINALISMTAGPAEKGEGNG